MKQINIDLEYWDDLQSLLDRVRASYKNFMAPVEAVVAGGAVRDMLLDKPISDIDVFYKGELNDEKLKSFFTDVKSNGSPYPDGFNVTHTIISKTFPVPIQLIQVEDIKKHIDTFPSPMMRVYVDNFGLHGVEPSFLSDASVNEFYWDKEVDIAYFTKIKAKYYDWHHIFAEDSFNPELEPIEDEF